MTFLLATNSAAIPSNIAFAIVGAMMVVAAIMMVTTENIVRAALYLMVVLAGVGVNFLLLGAEFVAVTQFLVYLGAIVVLFLFGVMLTKAPMGKSENLSNNMKVGAGVVAVGLFAVLAASQILTFEKIEVTGSYNGIAAEQTTTAASTATAAELADVVRAGESGQISDTIFGPYLIPFEVLSVLLLAALIGAIVIARKD